MSEFTLYRCTVCGKVSLSLGRLHAHIEGHRPLWRFWQVGDSKFLVERTERLEVTEYKSAPYPSEKTR